MQGAAIAFRILNQPFRATVDRGELRLRADWIEYVPEHRRPFNFCAVRLMRGHDPQERIATLNALIRQRSDMDGKEAIVVLEELPEAQS